jgi:hypothetical protein
MEGDMAVNLASCAGFVPGEWPLSIDDCAHCVHSRACHAPTREQRLQQHIAERDAFLAEDAKAAAPEPKVSISLDEAWSLLEHYESEKARYAGFGKLEKAKWFSAQCDSLKSRIEAASTHSQSEEG